VVDGSFPKREGAQPKRAEWIKARYRRHRLHPLGSKAGYAIGNAVPSVAKPQLAALRSKDCRFRLWTNVRTGPNAAPGGRARLLDDERDIHCGVDTRKNRAGSPLLRRAHLHMIARKYNQAES